MFKKKKNRGGWYLSVRWGVRKLDLGFALHCLVFVFSHVCLVLIWWHQCVCTNKSFKVLVDPLRILGYVSLGILLKLFMGMNSFKHICDVIKQNQSEVGNIDFKIEPNKAENVFCFLLFLASLNCSYLRNQLTNFQWGFLQNIAVKMMHTVS